MSPQLQILHSRLSEGFMAVPGARQLVLFGSTSQHQQDDFSDLDLQLLVDDCAAALPVFLSIIGEVVVTEIEWTFSDDPNHYWLMAIPDATRPWVKVDLGLDPYNDGQPEDLGWSGVAVWSQSAPAHPISAASSPEWPRPARGTIENFVLWQLVDLGMLAKYHHRRQPLNVLDHIAQLSRAVITVEADRQHKDVDFSEIPFSDLDVSSATIRDMNQTPYTDLGDMHSSLVDIILRLARQLRDSSGADERTLAAFTRMIDGCDTVLRGRYP